MISLEACAKRLILAEDLWIDQSIYSVHNFVLRLTSSGFCFFVRNFRFMTQHLFQVLFWGMRNMKRVMVFNVNSPKIYIDFGSKRMESDTIENMDERANFRKRVQAFDVVSHFVNLASKKLA